MSLREMKRSKYGGHRAPNGKFFLHKAIQGYNGCHPNSVHHSVPEFAASASIFEHFYYFSKQPQTMLCYDKK